MFQPGISGNPRGRPKGHFGGRIQALAALDRLLARKKNQQAIMAALEAELQADPARFFRNTIVPLLPRTARDSPPADALEEWQPLTRSPPSPLPPRQEPSR